jgi:hypothetical protein
MSASRPNLRHQGRDMLLVENTQTVIRQKLTITRTPHTFWREVYLRPLREIISPVRPKAISASVPGKGTKLNVS